VIGVPGDSSPGVPLQQGRLFPDFPEVSFLDRQLPPLGSAGSHALDAKVSAVLMAATGILALSLSSLGTHPGVNVGVGVLSLVLCAASFLRAGRDTWWVHACLTAAAATLIAVLTASIHREGDIGTGPILYVWIALQVGLMRPRREAVLQTLWCDLLYAAVAIRELPGGSAAAATFVTGVSLMFIAVAVSFLRERVDRLLTRLREQVEHDSLTGLYNRQGLVGRIEQAGAARGCVVLIDVDLFKQVNDRHGHAVGDATLAWLGGLLLSATPAPSGAARFGGEEFLVWLPGADLDDAMTWAEGFRAQVFTGSRSRTCPVTISAGVAAGSSADLVGLLNQADHALYQAKDGGRDQVRCAGAPQIVLS
jgi:diguanylate cyclase (GGDEF)-like protein